MRTLRDPVRRPAAIALAVLVVAVAIVAVASWPRAAVPTTRPATPSPTPAGPTPSAIPTDAPLPTPLPGATNDDQMAPCDPELRPRRGAPQDVVPPVPGPVSLEMVGQSGGTVRAATLDGGRMFVGSGTRVVEVDLSDPLRPRETTVSDALPGEVSAIERAGALLLVGLGDAGLAVVDPDAGLAVRGLVPLPGHVEAAAVVGSTAFVGDGPGGLRIVDLRDPTHPRESAAFLDLHRITDVAVAGDHAYLAAADEGLIVVDVSRPAQPVEVGRLFSGGYGFRLATVSGLVLLADGWGGLRVVDVSDPGAPRLVETIPTTGWAMDVAVDRDSAYVAAGNELAVVRGVTTGQAARASTLPLPAGHAARIDVADGRAVVVDDAAGVRIIDVSGGTPAELSVHAPLSPSNGLAVLRDRAYVAGLGTGLRVIDISDPRRPTEEATIRTADLVTAAVALDQRIVFSTWPRPDSEWVGSIFSLSEDLPPTVLGRPVAGPLFIGAAVDGSIAIVGAEVSVWLIDGRADRPCKLAELETTVYASGEGFEANGVTVAGDYLYVAPFYDQVRVVDVSDPRSPVLLEPAGRSDGVHVGKVLAIGRTLYAIGADDEGPLVALFDLQDPTTPRLTGTVHLPAETARADESGPHLAYGAGHLFVADGAAGLIVIDVSDPAKPVISGRLRLSGEAVGVVVQGEHAYVAANGGGFFVVEWTAQDQTSHAGEAIVAAAHAGASGAAATIQAQVSPACLVTAAADSGPGSLRECLARAGHATVVTFDRAAFPAAEPATIGLETPLQVPSGVTIDASGAGAILDGRGEVEEGLRVGSEATIRGLTVTGFTSAGICVDGAGNTIAGNVVSDNGEIGILLQGEGNRVTRNLIGLDPSGTRLWGRQSIGVNADSNSVIGGPTAADRNVISGGTILINLKTVHGTTIEGNYLGTDVTGTVAMTNGESRAVDLNVGSWGNRITANVVSGQIEIIDPGSSFNAVVGNLVGLDPSGRKPLEGGGGITIDEPFNQVGGSQPGEGNLINGGIGVQASDVIVLGNRLGVDVEGAPLGNGGIGVVKPRAVVGGRSPDAGNHVVRGSIDLRSESGLVIGNRIGRAELEGDTGVRVVGGVRNHLVANVVETRVARGIDVVAGASGNVFRGNVIRRNAIGLMADASSEANVIVGNTFERNELQARDQGTGNAWDDGRRGNFWSDFDAPDADGDGVRDRPLEVAPAGIDRYPLVAPP